MSDVHGHGTTLSIGGDTVGEVFNISGPNRTRATVDTTSFSSASRTREFIALRFRNEGEITLDLKYNADEASDAAQILRAAYLEDDNTEIILTLKNSEKFTCDGHITAIGHQIPLDDKVTQSVTIKLSGKGVWS